MKKLFCTVREFTKACIKIPFQEHININYLVKILHQAAGCAAQRIPFFFGQVQPGMKEGSDIVDANKKEKQQKPPVPGREYGGTVLHLSHFYIPVSDRQKQKTHRYEINKVARIDQSPAYAVVMKIDPQHFNIIIRSICQGG